MTRPGIYHDANSIHVRVYIGFLHCIRLHGLAEIRELRCVHVRVNFVLVTEERLLGSYTRENEQRLQTAVLPEENIRVQAVTDL